MVNYDLIPSDMDSVLQEAIDYVSNNVSSDVLQNPGTSSAYVAQLEVLAYILDILHSRVDIATRESTLSTALLPHQVEELAKNRGYLRSRRTAATGTLQFEGTSAFTVPTGFRVSNSSNNEIYITTSSGTAVDIGGGVYRISLAAIHAQKYSDAFTASGVELQDFQLVQDNPIINSTFKASSVKVDGVTATVVDSSLDSSPDDLHFTWTINAQDKIVITSGDNVFGKKLIAGQAVVVTYYAGGGEIGNCSIGAVDALQDTLGGLTSVSNTTAFTGGGDEETLASVKKNARSRRSNAMINEADYANEIPGISGINKAVAFRDLTASLPPAIIVYALPDGDSVSSLSTTQVNQIEQLHREQGILGANITVYSGFAEDCQVIAEVWCEDAATQSTVEEDVQTALEALLPFNETDFDDNLYLKDVYAAVTGVEGVKHCEIKRCCLKPYIVADPNNVGNPTYSDVIIKGNTEDAIYLIDNTGATSFVVTKRLPLIATSVEAEYIIDANADFTMESGESTGITIQSIADNTITNTDAAWVTNEWQNYLVVDSGGSVYLIASNTTDTLTLGDKDLTIDANHDVEAGSYRIVRNFVGDSMLNEDNDTLSIVYNTHNRIASYTVGDVAADVDSYFGKSKRWYIEISQGGGSYGTRYFTGDALVAFTITAGATPSAATDYHNLYTSNLRDDVLFKRDGGLLQLQADNITLLMKGGVA